MKLILSTAIFKEPKMIQAVWINKDEQTSIIYIKLWGSPETIALYYSTLDYENFTNDFEILKSAI